MQKWIKYIQGQNRSPNTVLKAKVYITFLNYKKSISRQPKLQFIAKTLLVY